MFSLTSLCLLLAAATTIAEKCLHPPPSENFSNQLYAGRWFEVGKYQTIGGAIFQIGTVCTEANFSPYGDVGDGDIGYSSRRDTPDGEMVNATGVLTELDAPGHFSQTLEFFGFEGPPTDYNVIYIDEDSAIEYDCSGHVFGIVDYCVHFMSRTPTIQPEKLAILQVNLDLTNFCFWRGCLNPFAEELVLEMGLNPHNLEYSEGLQEGCW